MAEIKIEKKQPIWPWILGILVVALVVYFAFFRDTKVLMDESNTNNDTISNRSEMQDNLSNSENLMGVAGFIAFVKNDDGSMTLDHKYSHEALTKLIDATEEVAKKTNFDLKMDLDSAREHADEITKNPEASSHADHIKKATDIISTVLQNVQIAKFPALQVQADKVKMSSELINVKELALNQKGKIKGFFDDAANLLENMNLVEKMNR